jgi:hypothetical protein
VDIHLATEASLRVSDKLRVSVDLCSIEGINGRDGVAVSIITIKSFALLGSFRSTLTGIC